jgi:hypothetical protein
MTLILEQLREAINSQDARQFAAESHRDGSRFSMRDVTIMTVRDGLVAAGRLYMEPTEFGGSDIDAVVRQLCEPQSPS